MVLRPLGANDFEGWSSIRIESRDWLTKWEPAQLHGHLDLAGDRRAFTSRCNVRDREWQLGTGYGFGIFINDVFAGELNVSNVYRGPFQNAYVAYWIGEKFAGNGYVPEALVLVYRYAFDDLGLHRLQISVVTRNGPSNRVMEKLAMRNEGVALRYIEINGVWEDHIRYAITSEDWDARRDEYVAQWLLP